MVIYKIGLLNLRDEGLELGNSPKRKAGMPCEFQLSVRFTCLDCIEVLRTCSSIDIED